MVMPPPPDNILVGMDLDISLDTGAVLSYELFYEPRPKPDPRVLRAGPTAVFLVWET